MKKSGRQSNFGSPMLFPLYFFLLHRIDRHGILRRPRVYALIPDLILAVTARIGHLAEQIEAFRGDKRFWEAFTFDSLAPDVLGVAAVKEGNILGMAGASADSPFFWQIGINVCPEARGKHVESTLVKILKQDILERGITPYYGTSMSNIGSQRVAHYAGFVAAWTELYADKVKK